MTPKRTYRSNRPDLLGDHSGGLLNANVQGDRIDTGRDGTDTVIDDGLSHNGGGGGTITGLGIGLGRDLLDKTGADILSRDP